MNFITDRLAVGNSRDGRNEKGLQLVGITCVLNVAIDLEQPLYDWTVGKKVGLICGPGNPYERFKDAADTLIECLKVHNKVMVFCHSGQDRSPTVVAAALAIQENLSFASALKKVRKEQGGNVEFTNFDVEKALTNLGKMYVRSHHQGPLVSILVPVYERLDLTKRFLEAIRKHTRYAPYELIGLNDGSKKKESLALDALLNKYCDRYLTHQTNQGIARSRADLNNAAKGEVICQMDNDVVVFPGWLKPLVGTLLTGDRVAIAAPLLTCNNAYFAHRYDSIGGDGCFAVDEVGTGCMLFRKSLIEEIGNFDPKLFNLWSDKDFCYRLSKRKIFDSTQPHRIVIDPSVCVYHSGRVNPQTGDWEIETAENTRSLDQLDKKRDQESMRLILERWGVRHPKYQQGSDIHKKQR